MKTFKQRIGLLTALVLVVMLMLTALRGVAQNTEDVKRSIKDIIPFGKKLPPPDLTNHQDKFMPEMASPNIGSVLTRGINHSDIHSVFTPGINHSDINEIKKNLDAYKQQLKEKIKEKISIFQGNSANTSQSPASSLNSNFHLTKDINALAESNARNFTSHPLDIYDGYHNDSVSYAVLDNVIYFVADDGIHGSELWRSDGTDAGTYMVKDLEPGAPSSLLFNITAVNGKIYFTAYSSYGNGAWVSDGTESGTQLLISVGESTEFFAMGKKTYFIADGDFSYWGSIWETDGTTAGTTRVIDIGDAGYGGEQITQPTVVNGILFFTFLSYEFYEWELWRSDGTDAGTYHVGPSYPFIDWTTGEIVNYMPAQLTNYNNKLYFSANDGTGRKLLVSDGTDAGTTPAPGNHDVIVDADYLGISFPMLNNVLYIPGEETPEGNGLYKYDASDAAGLVKIKDFAPGGDTAFIVPFEMQVVNNTLYFKVTNYNGGVHDELWSSQGSMVTTEVVKKFLSGETPHSLCNGNGTLYFVKYDAQYGNELWKTNGIAAGTMLVSDIFKGATSSYPGYLTAANGKLFFTAADGVHGNEIFMTDGTDKGTALVKDINTVTTSSSTAGFNFYNYLGYSGLVALGKDVLFNAYERVHGYELYRSDGTQLLNDVVPGEAGIRVRIFLSKNNDVYFLAEGNSGNSIYKTNGVKNSLQKITPDYNYIQGFAVGDNGIVFYARYNYNTNAYELWRSDGTAAGTFLLSSTLYYSNYLNVIGNTALFVAGDDANGYELWKSDGSLAGTSIVKDINPGVGNSVPGGMFIYKNEVYFAANDGTSSNPSFWKSNGTEAGTIKLQDIDPWWGSTVSSTARYFCVLNNILYFSAIDHSNADGTVFYKTDGTIAGTKPVIDINTTGSGGPAYYLTNVNGILFFTANDGVHGTELWKSNGTADGTQLVRDITPGIAGSNMAGLTSFGGKLFFQNVDFTNFRYYLWSSDGRAQGTEKVADPGISNVAVGNMLSAGNKLFIYGYTSQYGGELYVGIGEDQTEKSATVAMTYESVKTIGNFNVLLYPNPAASKATLQITGNTKNVSISITDMHGQKVWQSSNGNAMLINLPMEKFAAGIYIVTVTSGSESKTIKLVKQ